MLFREFINQKRLVIVDVQPAYQPSIHFMPSFAQFLENYNDILVLYNGPDLGMDHKSDIARFYIQYGVSRAKISTMKWHEKNYAWFRDAMDSCWARESIIRIIRYMLMKKVNDIRQLNAQDVKRIGVPELSFKHIENHFIGIPDLRWILPKWNGSDICGGAENECLDEVMILIEALKLQFHPIRELIY